jgi:hypothetical protein
LIMAPASAASSEVQADITFITYQFISDNQ